MVNNAFYGWKELEMKVGLFLILSIMLNYSYSGENYCGFVDTDSCQIKKIPNKNGKEYKYKLHTVLTFDSSIVGQNIRVLKNNSRNKTIQYESGFLEAGWFSGLKSNLMFIEFGTGPGLSGLEIIDISKNKNVFEGSFEDASIDMDTLEIWVEDTTKASESNCPEIKDYTESGLGAMIQRLERVSLLNFQGRLTPKTRCQSVQ